MDMLVESKKKVISNAPVITKDTTSTSRGGNAVPSGFILKLYQMVNGAPDEVITVSVFFFDSNEKASLFRETLRKKRLIKHTSYVLYC
jgi:hypothetical protein